MAMGKGPQDVVPGAPWDLESKTNRGKSRLSSLANLCMYIRQAAEEVVDSAEARG